MNLKSDPSSAHRPASGVEPMKTEGETILRTHLYYCSAVRSLPLLDPQRYCTEPLTEFTVALQKRDGAVERDELSMASVMTDDQRVQFKLNIKAEFKRVVTTDLLQSVFNGLDAEVPRLLEVDKAASVSGKKAPLKGFLDTNEKRRTSALLGLPHYLSEEPASVRMCDAYGETLDVAMRGMQVGLLIGYEVQLDKHTPKTSSLFRTKGGAVGQRIRSQMLELIQDPSASVEESREVVLRRLMESMVERREELISDHHSRDEAEVHAKLSRCPMKM
ncbi:hypothetical protein MHYP_G00017540 [Metynnis hypsauchen]